MLSFAKDVGYIDENKYAVLNEKLSEVVAKIFMFKKKVNENSNSTFRQKIHQNLRETVGYSDEKKEKIVQRVG